MDYYTKGEMNIMLERLIQDNNETREAARKLSVVVSQIAEKSGSGMKALNEAFGILKEHITKLEQKSSS